MIPPTYQCKCCLAYYRLKDSITTLGMAPCNHLVHSKCITTKCHVCHAPINKIYTIKSLTPHLSNPIARQMYVDILSIARPTPPKWGWTKLIKDMPSIAAYATNILTSNSREDLIEVVKKIFATCRVELLVSGEQANQTVVYVSNHTTQFDTAILCLLLNCSFLASPTVNKTSVGRAIAEQCDCVIVGENTTDRMIQKLNTGQSIFVYPEGTLSHSMTVCPFRTGAFNTGYPVVPVAIKYPEYLNSNTVLEFMTRCLQHETSIIEVTIMDVINQPFDDEKIQGVRKLIADKLNADLSRVTNKP